MRYMTIEEARSVQLDILDYIHDFCVENGIKYSICGGTLIGAVRHKGFIPWDDDIDIFMLRADYNKLIHSFTDKSGKYLLHSLETDAIYCYPYAKIEDTRTYINEDVTASNMGVAIDVFPVDNCMDDKDESISFVEHAIRYQKIYKAKLVKPTQNNSFITKCGIIAMKLLLCCFSLRKLAEFLSSFSQRGTQHSKYVSTMVSGYGIKELQLRSAFDKLVELPFENRMFLALMDYDKYLTSVYGDYMKLPPVENRRSPHVIEKMFWK